MHTNDDKMDPKELAKLKIDPRDIGYRPVIYSIAGIFFLVGLGSVIGYGFVSMYSHPAPNTLPLRSAYTAAQVPPGTPTIQTDADASTDIKALRTHEAEVLTTEGPEEGEPGYFHIPIDDAMRLILKRGLPVTTSAASVASVPTPAQRARAKNAATQGSPTATPPGTGNPGGDRP